MTAILAGCGGGDSGPQRYTLKGNVTYQGKPVPAGEVSFTPDTKQGNSGPGAIATIKNGAYETTGDKGVTPGPTVIIVTGYDGVAVPESEIGTQLFEPFETSFDIPAENTTHDIVVEDKK